MRIRTRQISQISHPSRRNRQNRQNQPNRSNLLRMTLKVIEKMTRVRYLILKLRAKKKTTTSKAMKTRIYLK